MLESLLLSPASGTNELKLDPVALQPRLFYRPDIDGLRAVAVVAVVTFHMQKEWLPGGFVGVDMFFAISGYVVMASLSRGSSFGTLDGVLGFFARRMKRLIPAATIVSCVTGLSMAVLIPPWHDYLRRYYLSGMLALVSMSNNYFAALHANYFDTGAVSLEMNPFTHTWTLGVEEQYYFFLPLCLFAAHGLPVMRAAGKVTHVPLLRPKKTVLGTILASSLLMSCVLTQSAPQTAYYTLPSRLWELMSGALLFELHDSMGLGQTVIWKGYVSATLQVVVFLLICTAILFTPEQVGFPFPWALLAISGTLLFITLAPECRLNSCLTWWLPVYIGKISYSIYLWHWPIFVLFRHTCGLKSVAQRLVSIFATIALASLSYPLENRIRAWRPRRHLAVFAVFLAVICISEMWLGALCGPLYGKMYIYPKKLKLNNTDVPLYTQNISANISACSASCHCKVVDLTLHPPPCADCGPNASALPACFIEAKVPATAAYFKYDICFPDYISVPHELAQLAQVCLTPDRGVHGRRPAIFLLGDSHAGAISAGMKAAGAGVFSVHWWAKSASHLFDKHDKRSYFQSAGIEVLSDVLRRGDIVAIAVSYTSRWRPNATATYILELYNISLARNASILLFDDRPPLPVNGWECLPTVFRPSPFNKCQVSLQDLPKLYPKHIQMREIMITLAQLPGIFFFSYLRLLCDDTMCGAFIPGTTTLAFYDNQHLTEAASLYLYPFICHYLGTHGLLPGPIQVASTQTRVLEDLSSFQ